MVWRRKRDAEEPRWCPLGPGETCDLYVWEDDRLWSVRLRGKELEPGVVVVEVMACEVLLKSGEVCSADDLWQ